MPNYPMFPQSCYHCSKMLGDGFGIDAKYYIGVDKDSLKDHFWYCSDECLKHFNCSHKKIR